MAAIGNAVSLEDWQAIVRRALDDAKNGDAKAREWLARYLLGVPKCFDQSPLSVVAEDVAAVDAVAKIAKDMSLDAALGRYKI